MPGMAEARQYRILLVDDEGDIAFIMREYLKRQGYEVDAFTSPAKALAAFRAGTYHLVLIDVRMPEMDGFALYERLRQVDESVRACFLTALDMDMAAQFRERHRGIPADCYLVKPIAFPHLLKAINIQLDDLAPVKRNP